MSFAFKFQLMTTLLTSLPGVWVGGRLPELVRHHRELLVQLVALELVRAGGHRCSW